MYVHRPISIRYLTSHLFHSQGFAGKFLDIFLFLVFTKRTLDSTPKKKKIEKKSTSFVLKDKRNHLCSQTCKQKNNYWVGKCVPGIRVR